MTYYFVGFGATGRGLEVQRSMGLYRGLEVLGFSLGFKGTP